jgi:hypothetical protein
LPAEKKKILGVLFTTPETKIQLPRKFLKSTEKISFSVDFKKIKKQMG